MDHVCRLLQCDDAARETIRRCVGGRGVYSVIMVTARVVWFARSRENENRGEKVKVSS